MKKDKELLDKELEELSPHLHELRSKDDGFRLPSGYFESLDDEIFQQLDAIGARRRPAARTERPGFWNWIAGLWQPRLALAFSVLLIATLAVWWLWRTPAAPTSSAPIVQQEEPTPEELEAYVMDNVLDFEPEQLAALAMLDDEPEMPSNNPETKPQTNQKTTPKATDVLSPEELELLINDLTDEEIEQML